MTRFTRWLALVIALGIPAIASAQTQEEVVYFHTDAVGSVRMVTDANGQVIARYDYLPFGEPWPADPTLPETRQFTGQEPDANTGFDYFAARHYTSLNGRFTTPDDPTYIDPFDPQSTNRYVYASNNPLRYIDPSGHDDCPVEGGICDQESKTNWWFYENLNRLGSTAQHFLQPVTNFLTAPRDPGCMAASARLGSTLGAFGGGAIGAFGGATGGGTLGTAGGPVGTLTLGFFGGSAGLAKGTAVGAVGGGAVGAAVGSVTCMTGAGGGGGGGGGGARVTFGHGGRHLAGTGIQESEVEAAITSQVQAIARSSSITGEFWGKVVVRGQRIFYRAFTLADGSINIRYLHSGSTMSFDSGFRPPTKEERELLQRLMEADFPGRDELARLIKRVEVRTIDELGGLELRSQIAGEAPVVKRIPVEAEAKDEDGYTIHVLLHVAHGQPTELEIFKDDGSRVRRMPLSSDFELIVLPPVPDN